MSKSINATHYDRIPAFPDRKKKKNRIVNMIVETPKHSCHKYALVAEYGIIAFSHTLPHEIHWPCDYGFVPQTLAPDGDPIDVLLVNDKALFSGCMIEARVIGAVRETKDGTENDRLIAVPLPSPGAPLTTDDYADISDMPRSQVNEIKDFLVEYSSEQGHRIKIKAIVGAEAAMTSIKRCMKKFRKSSQV